MKISEVDHVALTVSDIEKSLKFYQEVLGFETFFDLPLEGKSLEDLMRVKKGTRLRSIMLRKKGCKSGLVELVQFDPPGDLSKKARQITAPGVLLLSFKVLDEKLEDVFQQLQGKGVSFYSEPQHLEFKGIGIVKSVILEDPDGNMIELIELPKS
jgi:catechol 2,3-dioxygenase-like lactoylglutathione lyase family enzyme